MVDWGKFPLLSNAAAASASINQPAGFIRAGVRDQVLTQRLGLDWMGGDMSAILRSDYPFFPDILKAGPVVTLPGMDFQDAPGTSNPADG